MATPGGGDRAHASHFVTGDVADFGAGWTGAPAAAAGHVATAVLTESAPVTASACSSQKRMSISRSSWWRS